MKYKEVFAYFLRLGFLGFGGPIAVIAQIQQELIHERRWMSDEKFRQVLSMIKSMPGPIAYQMVVFLARERTNRWGALLAGLLFILPAAVMMVLIGQYYEQLHQINLFNLFFAGLQGGAFLLIAVALRDLTKVYTKKSIFWTCFFCSLGLLQWSPTPEPVVILGMGGLSILASQMRQKVFRSMTVDLVWVCFKAGALAFGSGLSIVPLLQLDFVQRYHWFTHAQFMDALAFGMLTPGPVVITVTFLGYKMAGLLGAAVATTAIFLPATAHMLTWFPRFVGWMSKQSWVSEFVMGATSALAAAIVLVLISMMPTMDRLQMVVPILLFLLGLKFKMPSWAFILFSGVLYAGSVSIF